MVLTQLAPALAKDWRDSNTTAAQLTAQLRAANVDMVIFLSAFNTTALHSIVAHWREIGYLPRVAAWLAGGVVYLPPDLQPYMLIEVLWLPTLTGAAYRAIKTETNFELFSANATHDSPAVFADAYEARFGTVVPAKSGWFQQVRAFHSLTIVQKLLEMTQSDDIETLRLASARIASPGVFHAIQFDQWGRSLPYDNFVLQLLPDGGERVLTPLGLGQPPILPMPTWKERVFAPRFYEHSSERVMLAITCVAIVYLLFWICWGAYWWQHPVLRASAPAFLGVSLVGLILLLVSNFFVTMHATDSTCVASFWTLTTGFSLAFGSLLLKNARIWALWANRSHSFAPTRLRLPHLAAALGALLLVDVALNAAWQGSGGMRVERHYVDAHRPQLDHMQCAYDSFDRVFVWTHAALKGAMLLSGVVLAWKLRKVAAQFSESHYIALCIYNAALLLILIMAMIMSDVGGHATGMLVRSYCTLYLAVSTATIMALPKLLALRAAESKMAGAIAARAAAMLALTAAPSSLPLSMVHSPLPIQPNPAGYGGGGGGWPGAHGGAQCFPDAHAHEMAVAAAAAAFVADFQNGSIVPAAGLPDMRSPRPVADQANCNHAARGGGGVGGGGSDGSGANPGSPEDTSPLPTLPFLRVKQDSDMPRLVPRSPPQQQQPQQQSLPGDRNGIAAAATATAALRIDSEHKLLMGTTMLRATCSLLECVDELVETDVQRLHDTLLRRMERRAGADAPASGIMTGMHVQPQQLQPCQQYSTHAHPSQPPRPQCQAPLRQKQVNTSAGAVQQMQPDALLQPRSSFDALLPLQQLRRANAQQQQQQQQQPAPPAQLSAGVTASGGSTMPGGGSRFDIVPLWTSSSPLGGGSARPLVAPGSTSDSSSSSGSGGALLQLQQPLSSDGNGTASSSAAASVVSVDDTAGGVRPPSDCSTPASERVCTDSSAAAPPADRPTVVSIHVAQ